MTKIKTLSISAKCSDLFYIDALDANGNPVLQKHGYVPDFMPGKHYGDYAILEIDVATGKILNWNVPTDATIKRDIANM